MDKAMEGQVVAKARDEFFRDYPKLLEGSASGVYLRNRLEAAFLAGIAAHEKHTKEPGR